MSWVESLRFDVTSDCFVVGFYDVCKGMVYSCFGVLTGLWYWSSRFRGVIF